MPVLRCGLPKSRLRVACPAGEPLRYGPDGPPSRDLRHDKHTTEQKNDGDSFAAGVGTSGIKRLAAVVGHSWDWRPSGPVTHSNLKLEGHQMTSRLSLSVPKQRYESESNARTNRVNRNDQSASVADARVAEPVIA